MGRALVEGRHLRSDGFLPYLLTTVVGVESDDVGGAGSCLIEKSEYIGHRGLRLMSRPRLATRMIGVARLFTGLTGH